MTNIFQRGWNHQPQLNQWAVSMVDTSPWGVPGIGDNSEFSVVFSEMEMHFVCQGQIGIYAVVPKNVSGYSWDAYDLWFRYNVKMYIYICIYNIHLQYNKPKVDLINPFIWGWSYITNSIYQDPQYWWDHHHVYPQWRLTVGAWHTMNDGATIMACLSACNDT